MDGVPLRVDVDDADWLGVPDALPVAVTLGVRDDVPVCEYVGVKG